MFSRTIPRWYPELGGMGLGHLAVSFTNVFTPFGRIHWEFVANDLPAISQKKKTLRNGVRASL